MVRVGGTRPIPVSVRIISATHCDLDARVREGRFRADLFYRLSVLRLSLPSLRQRPEDVPALTEWYLKNALASLDVRPAVNLHAEILTCLPLLSAYTWPGNVRELRNLMERLALFLAAEPLQALTPAFLKRIAPELSASINDVMSDDALTQDATPAKTETLQQVLQRHQGNREAAANYLGISRTTLWRRLQASGELNSAADDAGKSTD